MATYGIDPEEELANTASYQDAMASMAPTDAPSPIVDSWQTDVSPEAVGSPVVDPFTSGTPAPGLPPAPVVAPPEAVSAKVSESVPVAVPRYNQSGTATTGNDIYAQIAGAKNPGVAAARGTDQLLSDETARAQQLLLDKDAIYQGEAGVQEAASIEGSRLAEERAAEIRQMRGEAENQIRTSDEDIKEIASTEPDPGRFWSSRTTGQKALYYITAALQAFSKPDEVPKVAELMLKFVDDDIARQGDRIKQELDAAKGRAQSTRDMIVAGKSDAEAIHAQRTLRFESLTRGAMAKWVAAGKTAAATQEYNQTLSAIGAAKAKSFNDTADMTLKLREQLAQQAHRAATLKLQREELDYKKDQDAKKAVAAASAGGPVLPVYGARVYTKGPDGKLTQMFEADGRPVDFVPFNKDLPEGVVTNVVKKQQAQQELAMASAALYAFVDKADGTIDLLTDKRYIDLASKYAVADRNASEAGVMTEPDRLQAMQKVGLSYSRGSGMEITAIGDVKITPENVKAYVESRDKEAADRTKKEIYGITARNAAGGPAYEIAVPTGRDLRTEEDAKEKRSQRAASEREAAALGGGMPSKAVSQGSPEMPESRGRFPELDSFTSTLYYKSKGDRKTESERVDMAISKSTPGSAARGRLEATKKLIESTVAGMTPEQQLTLYRSRAGLRPDGSSGASLADKKSKQSADAVRRYEEYDALVKKSLGRDFVEVE